ncbi:MAG TPA: MBL fold metallo-hydrolase [Abditibacteriaceae bacterium]|jgi:L-ascorbate metabolism protein UlaG (beta-lactamase superfamily)
MKRFLAFALLVSASVAAPRAHAAPSVSIIPTKSGPIRITAKFHASTQIEYRGKVIVVDPVMAASWTKKADVILITHPHGDHLDLPAIAKLKKTDTHIYSPEEASETIETIKGIDVWPMSPGETQAETLTAEAPPNLDSEDEEAAFRLYKSEVPFRLLAVPMYNLVREREPGKKYHPREANWNGYVLTLGGKRLYFAGDTEATPEMKALKNIDAAFLPMNLPYTMTPQEAAAAAKVFKPRRVYPYHYRFPFDKDSGNERTFARLLRGTKTKVVLLNWYPRAAVQKMMKK